MEEKVFEVEEQRIRWQRYWELFQHHRWWFVLPAFAVFVVVWSASWLLQATYRSETLILVEQQKVPDQYVVPNIADDLQQRLQSMTQQILSRTRLVSVINQFNLYSKDRGRLSDDEMVDRMRKDIQIDLVRDSNRGRDLTAFKIAYLSTNPKTAQAVTTQLSSLFIDENLRVRQERSENTTAFLESELEQARQSLSAQEVRVREFKSHYLGELPGQTQSNVQILAGLQTRLQQEMDALARAKQQKVYLESMLSQLRSVEAGLRANPSTMTPSALTIDQEIERLQNKLNELTSRYSEQHPDVQKTRTQLAKARQQKEQRDAQITEAAKSATSNETPTAGTLAELQAMTPRLNVESELKANRAEIENRERSIKDLEHQIDAYQGRLNTTPLREQQLADLTRDYDQSRKNYEQLLAKRDQSSMATTLEKRQQGEQFRVIDPANLPQKPFTPNRLKLAMFGLLAGIVTGGVFLILHSFLHNVVYLRDEVKDIIEAPVIVQIPPLRTVEQEKRNKILLRLQNISFVFLGALTIVGVGMSFYFG